MSTTHEQLSIDGVPIHGHYDPERHGDPAVGLLGQVVTLLLRNGTVVTGVTLVRPGQADWDWHIGSRRFTYQLPQTLGLSKVEVGSVAAVYVHYRSDCGYSPITIYVGEIAPQMYGGAR